MSNVLLDPEKLKKRFHELAKKRDAIRAKSDPLREKRDRLVKVHAAALDKHSKEIRAAEKGLFDIEQEMAMISRAVPGRNVGEPDA